MNNENENNVFVRVFTQWPLIATFLSFSVDIRKIMGLCEVLRENFHWQAAFRIFCKSATISSVRRSFPKPGQKYVPPVYDICSWNNGTSFCLFCSPNKNFPQDEEDFFHDNEQNMFKNATFIAHAIFAFENKETKSIIDNYCHANHYGKYRQCAVNSGETDTFYVGFLLDAFSGTDDMMNNHDSGEDSDQSETFVWSIQDVLKIVTHMNDKCGPANPGLTMVARRCNSHKYRYFIDETLFGPLLQRRVHYLSSMIEKSPRKFAKF